MARRAPEGDQGTGRPPAGDGAPMDPDAWIADEGRVVSVARRAVSRARHRPGRILAVGALAAAAFVASRLLAPPAYEASLTFHLAEGDLTDPNQAPRPPRAVREYVFNVALSRDRIEPIMRKHGWSRRLLARDRVAAIDEFRDDVTVDVSRNYFVYDRRASDPPRSAVVTVSLVGPDPQRTAATLHEIGQAIVQEQRSQRGERLAQARQHLESELGRARGRVRSLQEEIGNLQAVPDRSRTRAAIDRQTQISALQLEAHGALDRLLVLERRAKDVAFTAAAEGVDLGLRLDLVDESVAPVRPPLPPLALARRALLVFVLAALLAVPVVGAFDDRVHAAADLAARGLPHLGSLPPFPGDDVGSYRARVRARSV